MIYYNMTYCALYNNMYIDIHTYIHIVAGRYHVTLYKVM